jgi:adenine-specific DNA-methyltransferase
VSSDSDARLDVNVTTVAVEQASDPALVRFQELLRAVFRFEDDELDFGIYRILSSKRQDVERFIEKQLPEVVSRALENYASEERAALYEQLDDLKKQVVATLGEGALDHVGEITGDYASTPLGERFAEVKRAADRFELAEVTRTSIFNDLYRFFDRYFVEGDFVPSRRYGRADAYVFPYHGENVFLYWANRDQYYVKTDDIFRAYTFHVGGGRVSFMLDVREAEPATEEEIAEDRPPTKARFVLLQDDSLE